MAPTPAGAQRVAADEGWLAAVWRLAADTVSLHKRRGTAEDRCTWKVDTGTATTTS